MNGAVIHDHSSICIYTEFHRRKQYDFIHHIESNPILSLMTLMSATEMNQWNRARKKMAKFQFLCYHLAISSSPGQLLLCLLESTRGPLLFDREDESLLSELDLEDELIRRKKEKKLRKALPMRPLSLDRLPLEVHEILRGAPPVLNPPSISVYTTGSSLSPALRPPENLPTAKPPPGSLHIVSPTASSCSSTSDSIRRATSVGISCRQTGQELRRESHGKMQSWW